MDITSRSVFVGAQLALWCSACTPHFSTSLARGPTHVTYAQRTVDVPTSDYLVDCPLDADGQPVNCEALRLEKVRR